MYETKLKNLQDKNGKFEKEKEGQINDKLSNLQELIWEILEKKQAKTRAILSNVIG